MIGLHTIFYFACATEECGICNLKIYFCNFLFQMSWLEVENKVDIYKFDLN
jgi:hypothetical protein